MNVSTISNWAKNQTNFTYMENEDDDLHSYESSNYDIPPFYFEKRRSSLNCLEMKTASTRSPYKTNFTSKLLSMFPKRIHSYKTFKIMVLGATNVGKTSLIERFTRGQFTSDHLPTIAETYETGIFLDFGNELKQFDLEIYDFNGKVKDDFPEICTEKTLRSDGFIVVYSKDEPDSLAKVVEIVADINKLKEAPVVMVLENKCDCKKNNSNQIRTKFQIINTRHMEVSAKSNIGVDEAIKTLIYDIEDKVNTDQQNKKQVKTRFLQRIF